MPDPNQTSGEKQATEEEHTRLLKNLAFGSLEEQCDAAAALAAIGEPWVIEPLIEALDDIHPYPRRCATDALAVIGEPAVDQLIEALGDRSACVRECAAEALGKIGSAQAVKHLIVALDDGADQVCQAAQTALQVIGTPEALKALSHQDSSSP